MRVALSFWIAGAAYVALIVVGVVSFVISGPDTWSSYLLEPMHLTGLVPPVVASLVALLLRRTQTIMQFIAAGLAFLLVAPATTFAAVWIETVLSSDAHYDGYYAFSVVLALLYVQIPQLVVAIIACAVMSVVSAARRSRRHTPA